MYYSVVVGKWTGTVEIIWNGQMCVQNLPAITNSMEDERPSDRLHGAISKGDLATRRDPADRAFLERPYLPRLEFSAKCPSLLAKAVADQVRVVQPFVA